MGITATYRRVTANEFKRLQTDKKYAARYFGTDVARTIASALRDFKELLRAGDEERSNDDPAPDDRTLNIDKDWQAIHFLLTGEFCFAGESKVPAPLCNIVMGGAETKWESTYGKIRILSQQQVHDAAELLKTISRDSLSARLDPREFNKHGVYPARDRWDAGELEGLLDVYESIRTFFQSAAENCEPVLISFD